MDSLAAPIVPNHLSPKERRNSQDLELRDYIEHMHVDFPGYGYRRIYHALLKSGARVNTKRIRRVMREHSLRPIVYRTFKVSTTDSNHSHRIYPNLIKGKETKGLNEIWVTDITYIRLRKEFIYLADILDRHSRKVVGWALSRSLKRELCLAALKDAITKRKPQKGCIHHSTRGVQYACTEYVNLLKESGFEISMSAKGNPYDNAHMESFFKSLKYEEVHLYNYDDFSDAIKAYRTILISFTINVVYTLHWDIVRQKSLNKLKQEGKIIYSIDLVQIEDHNIKK